MLQKNSRRQIGILIRRAYPEIKSVNSRPEKNFQIPNETRFDGVEYYPVSCPVSKCVLNSSQNV